MKSTWIGPLAVFALALGVVFPALVQQSSAQENQQKVPDEYRQAVGRANYAFRHAQSKDDYVAAAKLYQEAVNLAPWLPEAYFNLAQAQKSAEQFNDAINDYQKYLDMAPDAPDREKVKGIIEELKGEAQQAAQQPAQTQPAPATKEQSDADFIRSLDGARYCKSGLSQSAYDCITIQGNQLVREWSGHKFENPSNGQVVWAIKGRTVDMQAWPASQCAKFFENADCRYVYSIQQNYIEWALFVGGEKLPPPFKALFYGVTYPPDVFDRVQ